MKYSAAALMIFYGLLAFGQPLNEKDIVPTLDAYFNEISGKDEFSGVVLIAKNGRPVFERAYGQANKSYAVPVRADTRFNVGSINKVFTKVAILQLAEKNKLNLDDTIEKYVPEFPKAVGSKITVRQLLNHSSGLGDIFTDKYDCYRSTLRSIKDYLPLFKDDPLKFEPGKDRKYSNAGYILLGMIIERLSGQDYYTYVKDNIYTPAGMINSASFDLDESVSNVATGYTRRWTDAENAPVRSNVTTLPSRGSSAGGGYSTAQDLLRFVLAMQQSKLLSRKYTHFFFYDEFPATEDAPVDAAIGFAGGAPGVNALVEIEPASGYTIILLSNYDPPIAEKVGKKIRGWLL